MFSMNLLIELWIIIKVTSALRSLVIPRLACHHPVGETLLDLFIQVLGLSWLLSDSQAFRLKETHVVLLFSHRRLTEKNREESRWLPCAFPCLLYSVVLFPRKPKQCSDYSLLACHVHIHWLSQTWASRCNGHVLRLALLDKSKTVRKSICNQKSLLCAHRLLA